MSEQEPIDRSEYGYRYEKDEKDEKDEKHEKSWDEKWRHDPVGGIGWALFLIWMGVVFLLENIGFLGRFERLGTWNAILIGAGVIVLLMTVVRVVMPAYRRSVTGSLILGFVLLAIGLGGFLAEGLVLPAILIAIGLGALLNALTRQR